MYNARNLSARRMNMERDFKTNNEKEMSLAERERQLEYIEKCRQYVEKISEQLGRKLTANVTTFGCQMNARDSEKLLGILKEIGYETVESEEADLVLYNTCTVRENANLRVYGRLGHLNGIKRKNPHMIIALCGCMMQEPEVVEKIRKSYRFVDIIFGTFNIFELAELLYSRWTTGSQIIDIWKDTKEMVEELPTERKYAFKSGVNIMYGCDNFCSYCIVPYVRGREKSRDPKEIVMEIERLVRDGVKEVMLLGQNVNSYGKMLDEPMTFAELLQEIEKIDGLERIRFMTPHPKDLSDELIDVMAHSKKICNHIHLPLQSGSSRLLKLMNRKYTKEDYLALVERIRTKLPDVSLTTDIIVGFPQEEEEDFLETLDVVRKAKYDSAYTFIYSKRTGTPAAKMEDQVPEDVVKERFNRLLETVNEVSHSISKRYEGQTLPAFVEDIDDHDSSMVTGRLTNNMLVHFPGGADLIGKIVDVHLTESKGFYYMGEMKR
jgi:tRNA-2-methylthio-N6-dimethylallyladenosine synthase